MNESKIERRVQAIKAIGDNVDIPISDDHARLAAKWHDPIFDAVAKVRALDYQNHEPGAVFRPVVLRDESN